MLIIHFIQLSVFFQTLKLVFSNDKGLRCLRHMISLFQPRYLNLYSGFYCTEIIYREFCKPKSDGRLEDLVRASVCTWNAVRFKVQYVPDLSLTEYMRETGGERVRNDEPSFLLRSIQILGIHQLLLLRLHVVLCEYSSICTITRIKMVLPVYLQDGITS